MKLVNIHKQSVFILSIFMLFFFFGWKNTVQSQEQWSLRQCIDSALVYNKTLQISRNNTILSKERENEAIYNLLPKINASVDYKYYTELPHQLMPLSTFNPQVPEGQFREVQFGVPHNISASLILAIPLYNPNIYGAINKTQIASEITELQYQKSQEQVIYDISSIYYNLKILHSQLNFIDSNLSNTNRLLHNVKLLKQELLAKGTDVKKLELLKDQLSTQKEIIKSKYINALNLLKLTMGISLEYNIQIESDIYFKNSEPYKSNTALDVLMLKAQSKLLNSELNTINYSRFLPTLNLIASYGTTGFGYDKKPNDFLNFYSVSFAGIQLSYPIFDGLSSQKKAKQKEIEISNNNLQNKLLIDKINIEIENSIRQRDIAQLTVENTQKQIETAKEIYSQSILQHKEGTANLSDVLLADNSLRETTQNYIIAIIDYLKSDLELMKLTGNILKISE